MSSCGLDPIDNVIEFMYVALFCEGDDLFPTDMLLPFAFKTMFTNPVEDAPGKGLAIWAHAYFEASYGKLHCLAIKHLKHSCLEF